MDEPREDRASVVELRRFAALLNKLDFIDDREGSALSRRRILAVQSGSRDTTSVLELTESGNAVVDKCVATFATLAIEVDTLWEIARNDLFDALLVYGDDVDECLESEGGAVKMVARFLPFLQELSVFINRCYEVFRNILLQLYNFFNLEEGVLERVRERRLLRVWRVLGTLLSVLIYIDEIVQRHSVLLAHWSSFFKSMQLMHHNPAQFGAESELLRPLQAVVVQIDAQIMSGFVFKNCCQQMFDEKIVTDSHFNERMRNSVLEMYEKWDRVAADDMADKQRLIVIVSLASLHCMLFHTGDKKLLKTVWSSYKRLPAFHIIGDVVWSPCEFLMKVIPDIERVIDRKAITAMTNLRAALFEEQVEALSRQVSLSSATFTKWYAEMAEELREWPTENAQTHLTNRATLFFKGARQADLLSRLLKTVLCRHLGEQKALTRSSAMAVLRMIEIIKAIEGSFLKWWTEVVESCQQAVQQWSGQLLRLVSAVKQSLRSEANLSYEKVDVCSAFTIAENALAGAVSRNRLIVIGIALEMACYTKTFRWGDVQEADEALARIDTLSSLGRVLSRVCDCSFLFWHSALSCIFFESLISDPAARPALFFDAINDAEVLVRSSRHADSALMVDKYRSRVFSDFERGFLARLCAGVETDLRLSIHAHLQLDDRTPKDPLQDTNLLLVDLVQLAPLRICDRFVDVKRYVERYLERTFYNLTAVALHDGHTYTEMRLLARRKFGLLLCEGRLPFQTLDQGLDVLVVTRNIHSFVSNYNYNLNAQFFIEKESKNKQLNILTVEHIANSIRTHGMGIMNTTINFAYQYLKKKFFIFSQFLYDDHIKGQLVKDERYFVENADDLDKMYPVKRAQRFNSAIRRLGVTSDDLSFLDKFRILITQIGNVMGYVRLVRSGGVEASARSLAFLPDLDDIPSFAPLAVEAGLSAETVEAAKILDDVFEQASKNVNQSNNYLQILVEVFAKEFRNFAKFDHLSNFYVIVPPLTVNYVEYMLACKGTLGRRAHQNNTFTDDGFILGVAFILTLLDQVEQFGSLNWFQSVFTRCQKEMPDPPTTGKAAGKAPLEPSVALRAAKLEQYEKEFRLLFYTFHSAVIFFKAEKVDDSSAPMSSASQRAV